MTEPLRSDISFGWVLFQKDTTTAGRGISLGTFWPQ